MVPHTYGLRTELGHNSLKGLLVLLEERTELFVLVKKGLVLNDKRSIHSLKLGLEHLCR